MKIKSSEPFWIVKNGVLNSFPSLRKNIKTEVLIIGGGITGSLVAHACIENGYKTVVIDRKEIANGSTSATTSLLQYEIDVPLYKLINMVGEKGAVESYRACYKSIDDLGKIIKKTHSDSGFKKKKSLYFAAFKKDIPELKKEFEVRKKFGFPITWMESGDIKKKYHSLQTFGGILSDQGAAVDAFKLTHDLFAFNYKRGLEIYDKTVIDKGKYSHSGVTFTSEYGNTIEAKKVIYCTGYESVEIIKDKFVKLLSTYATAGERMEDDYPFLKDTIFWNTAKPYLYMRTTDDKRIIIGGEDEQFVDSARRDELLKYKSQKLEKQLKRILPDSDFRTDFSWAGTFGETKDGLPYIGKHPKFPSSYFVLSFGGNGICFSVIAMEMVVSFLKNMKHPMQNYFKFRR